MSLAVSAGQIGPMYNIVLSGIALYLIYTILQKESRRNFVRPWKFLAFAISVFIIESFFTLLVFFGITLIPRWMNAVFELFMVIAFIYMLLIQIEHVKKRFLKKA